MYKVIGNFNVRSTGKFYSVGQEVSDKELTADEIKGALGLGVIIKLKVEPAPKRKAKK